MTVEISTFPMLKIYRDREPLKTTSLSACSARKWFIISAKADCESSLAACSVRKWFIVSAKADCESSLPACSVRKWFIVSAKADCESLFRGFYTTINLGNTNIQT